MRSFLALALFALALSACQTETAEAPSVPAETVAEPAATRDAAESAEVAAGGALGVGDAAPDFALPGVDGEPVRLASLLERGPVVLAFYRGSWCPYCNTQLRDYQEALGEIRAAGASLVAVSPQSPDSSVSMQERNALSFPVVSDTGNLVSRDYGLVFAVDAETRERYDAVGIDLEKVNGAWELPVPATYVIDADGTIRYAFVEADYTQRATVGDILDAVRAL